MDDQSLTIFRSGSAIPRELLPALSSCGICWTIIRMLFVLAIWSQHLQADSKKVLLLNSYHSGYEWTDDIMRGVKIALANSNPAVEIHTEFMDTRRHVRPEFASTVAEFYKVKFGRMHFDAIIASDDAAAHFLLEHHDEIFLGVPVIVCGVNEYRGSSAYLTRLPETRKWLTGILETIDLEDNVNLVLKLHPATKMIVNVGDELNVPYVQDLERSHPAIKVRRLQTQNLALQDLGKQLSELPHDSVVILATFSRDADGLQFTMTESARFVCERSPVPVYGLSKNTLGTGIVGGRLIDGYFHGMEAGKTALAILNGARPSSIPIQAASSNRYFFDDRQLRRWAIPAAALPENSIIVEQSNTFYDRHKTAVWLAFGFIVTQVIVISILVASIARRRRIQKALEESEGRFRNIFESSRDAIGLSVDDRFAYVNPAWAQMFGYEDPIELVGVSFYDLIPPKDRDAVLQRRKSRLNEVTARALYRTRGLRRDQTIIDTEVRASVFAANGKWYTTAILRDITAEKRAEESLRESERQRDVALSAARMGTWRWHSTSNLSTWSTIQESLFGLASGEYDGTQDSFLEHLHPDDRQPVNNAVAGALESGADYRMEYRVIWKDGSEHWILAQGKVFLGIDGIPRGITGVSRDITEQRHAEDRIRYQLQLNQAITTHAAESLFLTDNEGRVTFLNPAAERTFGWTQEELLGYFIHDSLHHRRLNGEPLLFEECPIMAVLKSGETLRNHEDVFFHRNGDPVNVVCSNTPTVQDGQVTGAVMVVLDITASKIAALELNQQEEQFRRIFEQSPVGMAIIGLDDRYQRVNLALQHMLGYGEEDLLNRTYHDVTHPEDREIAESYAEQFRRREISRYQLEKRYLNQQSEIIWASLNVTSFRGSYGSDGSRIVIVENITERKLAEKELARQAHELALSNADLQQFAYVTSHDLQEPLRNIAAFSQMLARRYHGRLDAEADEFIGYIVTGVERMRSLIDDLLGYSRVVNSERAPFVPVDTGQAVEWALNNLRNSVESSAAVIRAEGMPTVTGDRILLVQLFQNLIGNAIKYRNGRPPAICITARLEGLEWVFSVKDNGIGIAPQYHERVFGVFKRLHGNEFPGTGIGLAICRKIVEKHNGRIWVESEEGQGADFRFTLCL
jgi:PAS domain S-box-containing protein